MPKINVLPKSLADLIAAGEVVERPASVVKELLENSIDAGATAVNVEIKNGGISYIRITDNGCGIDREDIRNAFRSHSTSKIATAQDLDSILTLGFRGEALASIAAVAKVEILTRTPGSETGTRYVIEAGEEILLDDAGCPAGTTIIVRNLFFSTPARMKFLKKDVTEANNVAGVVDRIALSRPDISFRFIREGKQTLLTSGSSDLLTVAREVFGKEFAQSLIPASGSGDGVDVQGYISVPQASRPNRNMQFFFINGRLVRTATGSAALGEAYKNSVMVGKFPSCILNISISPLAVDVNVHPAKTEVRFSNEKAVFNSVYNACRNALAEDVSRVQVRGRQPVDYYAPIPASAEQLGFKQPVPEVKKHAPAAFAPHTPVKNAGEVFFAAVPPVGIAPEEDEAPSLIPSVLPVSSPERKEQAAAPVEVAPVKEISEDNSFRIVGEAFCTYIIAEMNGKLIIIDKHAAHERIIYEKLKAGNSERSAQMLLIPATVTLTKEEHVALLQNTEVLEQTGFSVEDFGGSEVIVHECPMELTCDDVPAVIAELAGRFAEKKQDVDFDKLDHIFHSVACRSAIKAGDFTSPQEMELFVRQLLSMPHIRFCPHGRPVLIEMTQRELEKSFGRIE